MELWLEILISAFLVLAGIFGLAGSFGLVKLRDTMQRLHGPTKATTLGVGGVLIASMLYFGVGEGQFSFHELLITVFLFITAPITANFIAKTHMAERMEPEDIPETERAYGWAIYEDPPEPAPDTPEGDAD